MTRSSRERLACFDLRDRQLALAMMMPAAAIAAVLLTVLAAPARASRPSGRDAAELIDLSGKWRFRTGDNLEYRTPELDDSDWEELMVPKPWGRQGHSGYHGIAWYRRRVALPGAAATASAGDAKQLAIALGRVASSYELYAGGCLLGGVGRLPPRPRAEYDRLATYSIPPGCWREDDELVLALRVWRASGERSWQGGPYQGRFLIGETASLGRLLLWDELPELILSCMYFLIGLYFTTLFSRLPGRKEYLWFGLISLLSAAYCILRTQWKYELTDWFVALVKMQALALFLLVPSLIQFLWPLLGGRIGRLLRAYQLSHVALALVVLAVPGEYFYLRCLDVWELWVLPMIFIVIVATAKRAWSGDLDARTLLIGIAGFAVASLLDIGRDKGYLDSPRLVPYGFAALVFSMSMTLSNRFARVYSELEKSSGLLKAALVQETAARARAEDLGEELRRAHTDLVRAEKLSAIGRVAATIVHDLKNPLCAIAGWAELMSIQEHQEALPQAGLGHIRRQAQRLADMIEDILAFARGEVVVEPREVAIAEYLDDIIATIDELFGSAGLRARASGDTDFYGWFDPDRIRRVLLNLASNARDALPAGGELAIEARRTASGMRLSCADTGPGVPEEIRDRLFQEFATFGKRNGTGLGLAICRSIVAAHGGAIRYEPAPGGGACFVIELPGKVEALQATVEHLVSGKSQV
ncbi:MAG: hypothetical protein HYV63_05815 [Candidatus Schekmanbacteria bacterium]|nr:hypothetical protein [Candidatus Schekmanbacteria bacterium]